MSNNVNIKGQLLIFSYSELKCCFSFDNVKDHASFFGQNYTISDYFIVHLLTPKTNETKNDKSLQ